MRPLLEKVTILFFLPLPQTVVAVVRVETITTRHLAGLVAAGPGI
jgi:hypothetical protein